MKLRNVLVALSIIAVGCDGTATKEPTDAVEIHQLNPADGPAGETVFIEGHGFGDDASAVRVLWETDLIEVVSATDTAVEVVVPQRVDGGTVSIEVTSPLGTAQASAAFTYRGGYGARLVVERFQYANPAQFNPPGEDFLDNSAYFGLPQKEQPAAVRPALDSCVFNPTLDSTSVTFLDAGPQIDLLYNSAVLSIPKVGGDYETLAADATNTAAFAANADYTLRTDGGTAAERTLPALDIDSAVRTPLEYQIVEPNLGGFPFAVYDKSAGLAVTWENGAPADVFEIVIRGYKLTGGADDGLSNEDLICWAVDDGSFHISAADLGQLAEATHGIVIVSRQSRTEWLLEANQNSVGESIGAVTIVGGVELQ